MATRAAAFTVKIRSLYDYQLRLLHGIMPPPSGFDIANTVKYFSQTLLTVLKDVPSSPLEMLKNPEMDPVRMALYPNLDYKGLYNSLVPFIEVAPLIQNGLDEFGLAILQCLGCLMPFLDHDLIDNLPFLTASCIAVFPPSLHQEIVNSLCFYILPFTIPRKNDKDQGNSVCQSLSSVIMMLFQYSDDSAHHCQLLECLMGLRSSILRDLLCVVAHGAAEARAHAAKLLFYYWPAFNANLFDKRCLLSKFASNFVPFVCQRDMCPNAGNAEAAKVCYDHCISITFASDSPPPLYLCIECANEIHREHPNQRFFDILHMMQQVSMVCENKNCRSTDKSAYSICFSTECASYNGNHPIRYCQQCHNNRHNNRRGGDHITHKSLPPIWSMDVEMQSYMVEAIVSLLKEAQHHIRTKEVPSDTKSMYNVAQTENFTSSDRQSLGRYGVWLLVGRCTPEKDTPAHVLGRLLSMLFHWFHATVSSVDVFSGQMESSLEKLKNEYVHAWLQDVCSSHYKVFISCLLPHPPEYARVGGHWDTLASRTSHIKDGLNRLYCLIPYKVLTPAMWDYIMPYWMEAIVNDVPEKDLQELKSILSVIFLVDITPLKFDAKRLYHFIALRFEKTTAKVQEQALHWLQVLTILEITLPLSLLFLMFGNGVRVMTMGIPNEINNEKVIVKTTNDTEHEVQRSSITPVQEGDSGNTSLSDDEIPTSRNTEFETDIEHNLSCCILMLDILLNQMELQDIDKHGGINTTLCRDVCRLLKSMVCAAWISSHKCPSESKSECAYCESSVIWHQLSLRLIEYLSPTQSAHPPDVYIEDIADEVHSHKSPPEGDKKDSKSDVVINMSISDSVPGVLVHMPHVCSIMTATVETVSEQLDLAAIIPAEKVVSAVARAITLSETDVATATVQVAKPQVVDENEQPVDDDLDDYWQTSVGKFRFNIEDLPQDLQYIFQVLKELPKSDKPDLLYYMLQCLNILVLNGDAFSKAVKCHFGFFIWCQENLLIKNLWDLCNAENSHMCEVCVPLLLHCVTLPGGSDVFWTIIQEDFHNPDWRIRFVAVERVTVIARFMDSTPLRGILPLQAALANAFCYLISSIDDSNVYIAQRATLYLGTIHDRAIKALILCLEAQFDSVIVDRPMVLQSLYQLHNTLSDRRILTWDFFLNRFDALFLEAQINLEKSGDIPYLRDLRNTDLNSEIFIRKLHRAHEALSQSDGTGTSSLKTLSASFGTKWPYKRTMSAPASFIPRQDTKQVTDGHIHSLSSADDGNLVRFLHRAIDFEEADQETMHLLIFLLMQFLSRTDQAYPMEEKPQAKTQTIVLHHLYLLLGYNQNERAFYMPPRRLRASPVFNAFLSNLPQLLDQNHLMGLLLLPPVLILLQFCPCPHQQTSTSEHQQQPSYSLWFLEPHLRHSWLMSLLVLLYKYQYNQQPDCAQLQSLVKIVLKTLDSQHHYCRRIPATVVMPASTFRSRDVSQPSLGQDEPTDLLETPPLSPMSIAGKPSKNSSAGISSDANWEKLQGSQLNKSPVSRFTSSFLNSSMESQEVESELMAIPETENSNNSNHCEKVNIPKIQGSLDESNDVCCIQDWNKLNSSNIISENSKSEKELQVANVTDKKPLWFIGCEEESLLFQTAHPLRKCIMPFSSIHLKYESLEKEKKHGFNDKKFNKERCYSLGSTGLATAIAPAIAMSKTITTNTHKQTIPPSKPTRQEKFSTGSLDGWSHGQKNSEVKSVRKQNKVIVTEPIVSVAVTKANVSQHVYYRQTSLQAPPVERLLPIGELVRSPVQKTTQKSFKIENDFHGSPDSPLSKMDVMTIESPDEGDSESTITSQQVSPPSVSQLEIPAQERLLPIGPQSATDNGITELVEKVREALGIINDPKYTSNKLDEVEKSNQQNSEQNNSLKETQRDSSSRSASPRRLIKQVALESPPPLHSESIDIVSCFRQHDKKAKSEGNVRNQRVIQKVGPFALGTNNKRSVRNNRPGLFDHLDLDEQNASHASYDTKQTSFRIGDDCIIERCAECGTIKEEYSDEELGLCIIVLGTFIHREPGLAAPLLPDILSIVAKVALNAMYPWQNETNIHLPGGAISVAHQFLRCVLHQLAPNGVFIQMFQTKANESTKLLFFRSVAQALLDFNELNPIVPIQLLLESLNSKKTLPLDNLPIILANMACYLECLPLDIGLGNTSPLWSTLLTQAEIFFRRIVFLLPNLDNHIPLLKIMISLLKMPGILQFKGILDPFSKVLGAAIQNQPLEYHFLVDLCYLCYRNFNKERDKLILCRMIVFEFVQALKFKTNIPDANFLLIINFILQDAGGSMPSNVMLDKYNQITPEFGPVCSTSIADCMRHHLADVLEFLADFHTLSKLKTYRKQGNVALNEDTFGGTLKSGVAQYLALELTRSNNRDNRAVARYMPWLYNAPSAIQQGQRDFIEWVGHIRLLSWLLLGSLTHTSIHGGPGAHHSTNIIVSQPIPQEAACHIADHIQVIMSGFAEQSKLSVLHMSSLFHAFILCQLWTVYLEQNLANHLPISEGYNVTMGILFDFWGKVTPCILQLVSYSKVLAEMVNLHFLSMLEALLECRSTLLSKLLPLWSPVLYSHHVQLPGNLQLRLQNCRNFKPTINPNALPSKQKQVAQNPVLLQWLQRLQFKMGQIELQSSTATQFYSV